MFGCWQFIYCQQKKRSNYLNNPCLPTLTVSPPYLTTLIVFWLNIKGWSRLHLCNLDLSFESFEFKTWISSLPPSIFLCGFFHGFGLTSCIPVLLLVLNVRNIDRLRGIGLRLELIPTKTAFDFWFFDGIYFIY